jgi:hypothetical protein
VIQRSADIALASGLVIAGCWLAVVAGLLPSRVQKRTYRRMLARLLRWATGLLGVGVLMLATRTVLAVLAFGW